MVKLILGLTGMPACGKSTCSDHIREKKGVAYIHLSDFVWQQLEKQGIRKTNITGAMYGLYMHEVYKDKPIIEWTDEQIRKNSKAKIILLDSIRAMQHHNHLKKKYGEKYKLVAVLAGTEERFDRQIKRKRFGEEITRKILESRDADELERGIGDVIALADYYIDASGSMKQMLAETDKLFAKVMRKA